MIFGSGVRSAGGARVCLVTGTHLWRNPRIVKEADALSGAGFEVTVVGPVIEERGERRDRALVEDKGWDYQPAPDLMSAQTRRIGRVMAQAHRKISVLGVERLGLQLPSSLGYGPSETVAAALSLNADIYGCHTEVGLLAFRALARQGRTCVVDLEDWHSRDLSEGAQRERPIALLQSLERQALRRAAAVTTTSLALAAALKQTYGGKTPSVVYNAFPREAPRQHGGDRRSAHRPSLHWYSQTLGPNRGLEVLIDALNLIKADFEIHLRGDGPAAYCQSLTRRASPRVRQRLFIHESVPPGELGHYIGVHDIGLALERASPDSRNLTITNKVFQFLQGGCAIMASRTAGQIEAAKLFPGAIELTELDAQDLASRLEALIRDPERLALMRAAARQAALGAGGWEQESGRIIDLYEGITFRAKTRRRAEDLSKAVLTLAAR